MKIQTRAAIFAFTCIPILQGCNTINDESQRPSATKPALPVAVTTPPQQNAQPSATITVKDSVVAAMKQQAIGSRNGLTLFGVVPASPHMEIYKMTAPIPLENRDRYAPLHDNPIHLTSEAPVSTFSVDVDTGSYSNVRRMLVAGQLPPKDAVRIEEIVNYFPYDYPTPQLNEGRPFAIHTAITPAPWNSNKVLLTVGIKGIDVAKDQLPPANLVFLVDVSGSMTSDDKLPLLKSSLKLLVRELRAEDRITLITYASGTQVVLAPTTGADKATINLAIDSLNAGGSTAGASGIELAYSAAKKNFIKGGINRILLATDGDFNVGVSDTRSLVSMVEERRKSGISLSTLGFGSGNYNEAMMEQLADSGDGAYSYIDSLMEGHKVLVNEMTSTLATIARDVKVQIEFNPSMVTEYRQIGYENRQLSRADFTNDKVDAGDIGAGHTVTAIYELTLKGQPGSITPLRYSQASSRDGGTVGELGHLRMRYKTPDASESKPIDVVLRTADLRSLAQVLPSFRFAIATAGFGELLRGGKYTSKWDYKAIRHLAQVNLEHDRFGYRHEFIRLVDIAQSLTTQPNIN